MESNSVMSYKLQKALNSRGCMILCNRKQFYSAQQNRPITIYTISQGRINEETGKTSYKELFSTPSQIQSVLFLRNLWYLINDMDIPKMDKMKGSMEFEQKWNEFLDKFEEDFKWKYKNINN